MLGLVRYFARLGLFTALMMLNASVVLLLFGHAKGAENLIPLSKSALYGAAALIAVSTLVFIL